MAKFNARGRVVVSAWSKKLPDTEDTRDMVYFRSLMSDGNVLTRHSFTIRGDEFFPAKRVHKPWTIGWQLTKGQPMPKDIAMFDRVMQKQGYSRI